MPAKSEAQRRLAGAALAFKRGQNPNASEEVKRMANSMSVKQLRDFARKE